MPASLRVVAVLLLTAGPLAAQDAHAHIDAFAVHDYRWRGIQRATGWNLQLEGTARIGGARTGLAIGAWNNFELSTHRNGTLSDLRPGHWGLSETDLWTEVAHSFSFADAALGFVWYEYRGRNGPVGTGEVYARFRGSGRNLRKLSPELSVWYDVDKRESAYVETGLTAPVLALPFRGLGLLLYANGSAGFAVGRSDAPPALASTSFAGPGFTSAELSAGLRLDGGKSLGGLLLRLSGHLQYAEDPATRRSRLDPPERSGWLRPYLTLGAGIRWPAPRDR